MNTLSSLLNPNLVQKYFRIIVFVLIIFFVAVSLNSLIRAIGWVNRPFPGFLLYENSLVAEVSLSSWSGYRSGLIKYHDEVITVNGHTLSPHQIYGVVSDKPVGTPINYTISRNDKIINLSIPNMKFGLGDFFLIFGVVYLGLGILGMALGTGDDRMWVAGPLTLGQADHGIHILLGVIFLAGGLFTRRVV